MLVLGLPAQPRHVIVVWYNLGKRNRETLAKSQVNITPEKFKKWREVLASQLVAAYTHYHIWEQLWPSEESLSVLNRFRVFFHHTIAAHLQLFFLHVTKVTEDRRDSINLWRLLDEVEKSPCLVPRLSLVEVRQLRKQLKTHGDVLRRIRTHRDKRIAHVDERHSWPDDRLWQDNVVTVGEAKVLLQDLEDIFNKLSAAHDGQRWSLKTIGLEDTSTLLKVLLNYEDKVHVKSVKALEASRSDSSE